MQMKSEEFDDTEHRGKRGSREKWINQRHKQHNEKKKKRNMKKKDLALL